MTRLIETLETGGAWEDLTKTAAPEKPLRALSAELRGARRLKSAGGGGRAVLFAGAAGTGKTMAARVLAGELGAPLLRVDLAAVTTKTIGETEKNLDRVFDAAEAGSAVLLFDGADALLGKRSDVKDSHDRYANIETNSLLQRIEQYGGVVILTTNLRANLDPAVARRLRAVIDFPPR